MGPSNSFGIPSVLLPVWHYRAGSFAREELPWVWSGARMVNGHCQKALCEVQTCPVPPQPAFGGTAVCQEPAQVPLQPGLMQALCSGIAWHMDHVHVRFWLLSNCITGLFWEDTPSVQSINVKCPFKICIVHPKEHWSTLCFYNASSIWRYQCSTFPTE